MHLYIYISVGYWIPIETVLNNGKIFNQIRKLLPNRCLKEKNNKGKPYMSENDLYLLNRVFPY